MQAVWGRAPGGLGPSRPRGGPGGPPGGAPERAGAGGVDWLAPLARAGLVDSGNRWRRLRVAPRGVAAMPAGAGAALLVEGRCRIGGGRRLAHPGYALADELLDRSDGLAVGRRHQGDRSAGAAGAPGAPDAMDII